MKNKNKIIVIAVLIVGYLVLKNSYKFPLFANTTEAEELNQGIVTELFVVERVPMIQDLSYLGTLESDSTALVSSKAAGNISFINVVEGDIVHEGDILVQIDTQQLEAKIDTIDQKRNLVESQLSYLSTEIDGFRTSNPIISKIASAKLSLDFQRAEVDKLKILYEGGAVAKVTLDQGSHQLETLRLQIQELQFTADQSYDKLVQEKDMAKGQLAEIDSSINELLLSVEEASIKAPFDGQVTQLMVSVGEMTTPGRTLAEIDNVHQLRVVTQVGESDLKKISVGMEAEVVLGSGDQPILGKVSYISPSVNPKTRIGEVRIEVSIPENMVVIGSSARIRILLDAGRNEIMIPVTAVKTLGDRQVVYVYNGKEIVNERTLTLGESVEGMYQVTEGLAEGDVIAVRNVQSLGDGVYIYTLGEEEEVK